MSSGSYMPVMSGAERAFSRAALFLTELAHRRPPLTAGELVQECVEQFPRVGADAEMLSELRLLAELVPAIVAGAPPGQVAAEVDRLEREIFRHARGRFHTEQASEFTWSGVGRSLADERSAAREMRDAPVRQIGGVIVLRRHSPLGTGPNNRVYYGLDVPHVRLVAVKILDTDVASTTGLERFKNEIRLLSKLRHRGVVRLHDWGRLGSIWYLVMDLVQGATLADRRLPHWQSRREAVRLMVQVARSAHAFHLQGIVHRDLKPSNLLIDEGGNVVIGDFGLAWGLSEPDLELTLVGQLLGTPAYMAPEQISSTSRVGTTADIHAIGAMLYHFTTGRLPFVGRSLAESLWLLETSPPTKPSEIDHSYPASLEQIVLRCLEKAPEDRYQSCPDLVADLEPWLHADRDMSSSWLSYLRRSTRTATRLFRGKPRLLMWGALACLVLAALWSGTNRISDSHSELPLALTEAIDSFWSTDALGASSHAELATTENLSGAPVWALGVLGDGVLNRPLAELKAHNGDAYELAIGPRERLMATTRKDGRTRLWRVRDGKLISEACAGGPETNGVCFDDRGDMLFWGDDGGRVHGWSIPKRQLVWTRRVANKPVFPVAWLGNEHSVVAGTQDGTLVVLDRHGGIDQVVDVGEPLQTLDVRPEDGAVLVGADRMVWLWRPGTEDLEPVEAAGKDEWVRVARALGGSRMAIGISSGRIRYKDPGRGLNLDLAGWHGRAVTAVSEGIDEELLTSARDGTVWVRDLRLGLVKAVFVHPDRVWDIDVLSSKEVLVTTCGDGILRKWNLRSARVVRAWPIPEAVADRIVPDGERGIWISGWGGLRHIQIEELGRAVREPAPIAADWLLGRVGTARWVDRHANLHVEAANAMFVNGLSAQMHPKATNVAASAGGVVRAYGEDAELVISFGATTERLSVLNDPIRD